MNSSTDLLCQRDEVPVPETLDRTPNRPLGALSDFVAEQLPRSLHTLSPSRLEELISDAEKYLSSVPLYRHHQEYLKGVSAPESHQQIRVSGKDVLRLALLDLAMLEGALVRNGHQIPSRLSELTQHCAFAMQSVPGLMYEGLIYANPLEKDPRVFSPGNLGQAELFFYEVHRRIEQRLAAAVKTVPRYRSPRCTDLGPVHETIDDIQSGFRSLHVGLLPDEFAQFRDVLSNAHRRIPGPSALFSAGMFSLDAILARNATGMYQLNQFKLKQERLFPTTLARDDRFCGREDMRDHHLYCGNVDGLLFDSSYPLNERLDVAQRMMHTREIHLGVAKRFIPEGFHAKGTGGVQALKEFLQIGVEAYRAIHQLLPLLSTLSSTPPLPDAPPPGPSPVRMYPPVIGF